MDEPLAFEDPNEFLEAIGITVVMVAGPRTPKDPKLVGNYCASVVSAAMSRKFDSADVSSITHCHCNRAADSVESKRRAHSVSLLARRTCVST